MNETTKKKKNTWRAQPSAKLVFSPHTVTYTQDNDSDKRIKALGERSELSSFNRGSTSKYMYKLTSTSSVEYLYN